MDFTAIDPTDTEQQYLDARREHHEAIARSLAVPCAALGNDRRARVYAYLIKRERRTRAAADVVFQAAQSDPRR